MNACGPNVEHLGVPRQDVVLAYSWVDDLGEVASSNLLYDVFFGAPDGLRAFKTWLGFRPYYVRWTREPARPGAGS